MTLPLPREPEGWPVVTRSLLFGSVGNLLYMVQTGPFLAEDQAAFLSELANTIDSRRDDDRIAVIYALSSHFSSSVELLRGLLQVVSSRREKLKKTSAALAYATENTIARAALRTMMTFAPLPYPVQVGRNAKEGVSFLEAQLPGLAEQNPYERLVRRVRDQAPHAIFA